MQKLMNVNDCYGSLTTPLNSPKTLALGNSALEFVYCPECVRFRARSVAGVFAVLEAQLPLLESLQAWGLGLDSLGLLWRASFAD